MASILASFQAFIPASILTFYLEVFLTFYLTYLLTSCLAFSLACVRVQCAQLPPELAIGSAWLYLSCEKEEGEGEEGEGGVAPLLKSTVETRTWQVGRNVGNTKHTTIQ